MNAAEILASNKSAGSLPVSSDLLKITLRDRAMLPAQVFNTVFGVPSGPAVLKAFSFLRSLGKPAVEIFMFWGGFVLTVGLL